MIAESNNNNVVDLQLAGGQSWSKTSADLAAARNSDSALDTRLKCAATSPSSRDVSENKPMNQELFSTGKNLHNNNNNTTDTNLLPRKICVKENFWIWKH